MAAPGEAGTPPPGGTMRPGLRLIWRLLGFASLLFIVALFFLPASWEVEAEATTTASPAEVWPHLEDLRAWSAWSPWQESDYEGLVYEYSERTRGAGAEQRWETAATGDGMLRFTAVEAPSRLELQMVFQKGRVTTRDEIALASLPDGGTHLSWSQEGTLGRTLLGRLSLPVVEESMGRDLESGLERLAAVAEGRELPPRPAHAGRTAASR